MNAQNTARRGVTAACATAVFAVLSFTMLPAFALGEEQSNSQATEADSSARNFEPIRRSLEGTTKTVQITDGSALVNDLVTLGQDDEMYLRKLYITNGNFFVITSINRGVIGLELPSGINHYFYIDKYERQEHTFDPPILIESGTEIRTYFNTQSGGALTITLLGSTDPLVFQDRFESRRLR